MKKCEVSNLPFTKNAFSFVMEDYTKTFNTLNMCIEYAILYMNYFSVVQFWTELWKITRNKSNQPNVLLGNGIIFWMYGNAVQRSLQWFLLECKKQGNEWWP